ncbi:MAG: TraM recognition domain-containing protein [Acetobacteraceae bacterium]|nr:TraM recognition domain-containing protein [Acetobacteraceae bacterium]
MDAAASPGRALAQLEAIYGATNAGIILDNLDTQIFYRPNRNWKTVKTLSKRSALNPTTPIQNTVGKARRQARAPNSLVSHLPNG